MGVLSYKYISVHGCTLSISVLWITLFRPSSPLPFISLFITFSDPSCPSWLNDVNNQQTCSRWHNILLPRRTYHCPPLAIHHIHSWMDEQVSWGHYYTGTSNIRLPSALSPRFNDTVSSQLVGFTRPTYRPPHTILLSDRGRCDLVAWSPVGSFIHSHNRHITASSSVDWTGVEEGLANEIKLKVSRLRSSHDFSSCAISFGGEN